MFFSRIARAAFTIIELLVVVAIILFLATIMVPRYSHYYARARQAEVAINLTGLYTAEQAYFVEHGRFTTNLKALGWQPKGYVPTPESRQNFYTYGFEQGAEGINFFSGTAEAPASALSGSFVQSSRFTVKAAAIVNEKLEVWMIDEGGNLQKITGQ